MITITRALKLTDGAKDELILHYITNKWLDAEANPSESELTKLALQKIKQDPSHYNLFIAMLRDTEGMDIIVVKITGGELRNIGPSMSIREHIYVILAIF